MSEEDLTHGTAITGVCCSMLFSESLAPQRGTLEVESVHGMAVAGVRCLTPFSSA
jgi:hypothetical protein